LNCYFEFKMTLIAHTAKFTRYLREFCGVCVWSVLIFLTFHSLKGNSQDLSPNTDFQESELSLSLSTRFNLNGASGGSISIDQFGLYNTTNIIQAGSDSNVTEVNQQGSNNQAEIIQLGVDNKVHLLQNGENNLFQIVQDGNANIANVNQLNGQRFMVRQIGNEMIINITQY
jgi:minor curlin subunit